MTAQENKDLLAKYLPTIMLMIATWFFSHLNTKASTVDKLDFMVEVIDKRLIKIEEKMENQFSKDQITRRFEDMEERIERMESDIDQLEN